MLFEVVLLCLLEDDCSYAFYDGLFVGRSAVNTQNVLLVTKSLVLKSTALVISLDGETSTGILNQVYGGYRGRALTVMKHVRSKCKTKDSVGPQKVTPILNDKVENTAKYVFSLRGRQNIPIQMK